MPEPARSEPSSGFAPPSTQRPERVQQVQAEPEPVAPVPTEAPGPTEEPVPAVAAVDPAPAAAEPAPAPPEPVVAPEPAPAAAPEPVPAPRPEPVPAPKPEPVPEPRPEPLPAPRPEPAPAPAPAPAVAVADVTVDEESPLVGLGTCTPEEVEGPAAAGQLSAMQRGCIELALAGAEPAARDRLSLALVANALALGDTDTWSDLVVRHLSEIDPTNPALAYRLALHRFEQGDATGAYTYAEQALANRAQWSLEDYASKTFAAHKLKAAAAQAMWQSVERRRADGEADTDDVRRARERTGYAARAWHNYAQESGQPPQQAATLCRLADTDC